MFDGASSFNGDVSSFVLASATVAGGMFRNSGISQDLCFLDRGRRSDLNVVILFQGASGCATQADPDLNSPMSSDVPDSEHFVPSEVLEARVKQGSTIESYYKSGLEVWKGRSNL